MRKKTTIIVVPCLDQGAGNDPEALGLAFHQGPTFRNAYCQAATNVVDRNLGLSKQCGGNDLPLRSLRAPSSYCCSSIFMCFATSVNSHRILLCFVFLIFCNSCACLHSIL